MQEREGGFASVPDGHVISDSTQTSVPSAGGRERETPVTTIAIPWSSPVPQSVKGIVHVPAHNTPIRPDRREALLIAIAAHVVRAWAERISEMIGHPDYADQDTRRRSRW
jgi:hypothetical protein